MVAENGKLLVQIATYNTNLQGNLGLPQDLVDWLAPTLQVASFLSHDRHVPDIVAVGFQELLPLHFGLAGLSRRVIDSRDTLIRSQIEKHAPNGERYSLVAKVVNVGAALLVYARDDGVGQRITNVQTQWSGCGPKCMGNKGAVGIRFRVTGEEDRVGETFTFVNAHLTAHAPNLNQRISDFHHLVSTMLFLPPPSSPDSSPTTMYSTSHLFFLGDLNFRLALNATDPLAQSEAFLDAITTEDSRRKMSEHDQLLQVCREGLAFAGLREGPFWKFKCTFKYHLNEVEKFNFARLPSWTDRILYTTYADDPDRPDESDVKPLLYTSIPSYTTSDHKPVVAILHVPTKCFTPASTSTSIPLLRLPPTYTPMCDPNWRLKRYGGRILDRVIGLVWTLLWYIGLGNVAIGTGNLLLGAAAWLWMAKSRSSEADGLHGA